MSHHHSSWVTAPECSGVSATAVGNHSVNIVGNVAASGNVDASNIVTILTANANVIVNGKVYTTGNVPHCVVIELCLFVEW